MASLFHRHCYRQKRKFIGSDWRKKGFPISAIMRGGDYGAYMNGTAGGGGNPIGPSGTGPVNAMGQNNTAQPMTS